jgi:beta-glucosidase
MEAVAMSRPDVPGDASDPVFEFGHGLRYAPTADRASTTMPRAAVP